MRARTREDHKLSPCILLVRFNIGDKPLALQLQLLAPYGQLCDLHANLSNGKIEWRDK